MHTYSLIMLTIFGMWRPINWTSKFSVWLYRVYTATILIIYCSFMISEILDIILIVQNIQQITENMIQLINILNVFQKILTFLTKKKKIIKFMNLFFDDLTLPETYKEKSIQNKFDSQSRKNSIKLFILYTVSVVTFVYMPFFISDIKERVLPYRGWRPYTIENINYYYLTYLQQSIAVTTAAIGNAATETLVSGFMIQICAQFEILEHRFIQLPKILNQMRNNGELESKLLKIEKNLIVKLIHHHLRIFTMTELLNNIFVIVILFQFISSISILCVCTYNLAISTSINEFFTIFLYLCCMLLQIFLYTWYGNEITLRSIYLGNTIFLSNWKSLSFKGIKNLMIIFQRTRKPIILTSGCVISLSNIAFTSIVKTSYSVYNFLTVQNF